MTKNLIEHLLENGITTSISNTKGDNKIKDKKVYLKDLNKANTVIDFDLLLSVKNNDIKFTVSKAFFNSIPELELEHTGMTYVTDEKLLFLYVCTTNVKNALNLQPLFLNNKKGDKKSLIFKSQALEYFIDIVQNIDKTIDADYKFKLVRQIDDNNLYQLIIATLDTNEITNKLDLFENKLVTNTNITSVLNEVKIETNTRIPLNELFADEQESQLTESDLGEELNEEFVEETSLLETINELKDESFIPNKAEVTPVNDIVKDLTLQEKEILNNIEQFESEKKVVLDDNDDELTFSI